MMNKVLPAPRDVTQLCLAWMADVAELIKLRLTVMVLATSFLGFYLGSSGRMDGWLLLHTMAGTALVAAGSAALNQLLERDADGRMRRTADRPLPAGRMGPDEGLVLGFTMSVGGLAWLAWGVNLLAALVAALTLGIYLFIYTPMKRVSSLNTPVGAVAGALPPLLGWVAAQGSVSLMGWTLFAILFLWQMPHFMAIAWLYREDYARAGFRMISLGDEDGKLTAGQGLVYAVALVPATLVPSVVGVVGPAYFAAALLLGLGFGWLAFLFFLRPSERSARLLFLGSILYLPLLMVSLGLGLR
ncbi:MAG: heme o synthase [Candidatus Methylacidiphilales bacterium]